MTLPLLSTVTGSVDAKYPLIFWFLFIKAVIMLCFSSLDTAVGLTTTTFSVFPNTIGWASSLILPTWIETCLDWLSFVVLLTLSVADTLNVISLLNAWFILTLPVIDNEPLFLSAFVKFDVQPFGNVVIVVFFIPECLSETPIVKLTSSPR